MTSRMWLLLAACSWMNGQTPSLNEARDSEQFMGRWNRALAPELIRFASLTDTGKLLDYGCGTGPLALRLAARYPGSGILGVDLSESNTAFARLQAPRATVRFQTVSSLVRLPFSDGEFDAVLSLGTFASIEEASRAIAELRRVTKPEGVVAAAVWDYGDGMQPLDLFWQAAVAVEPSLVPGEGPQTPFSKQGQLAALWKSARLRDVSEQATEVEITYRNFQEYWGLFLLQQGSAGRWLATLPDEKRSAVREKLRSRILGSRADGPFTLRARAWMVRGVVRME